jgi:hypothetical protein
VILDLLRDADAHAQPREGWKRRPTLVAACGRKLR